MEDNEQTVLNQQRILREPPIAGSEIDTLLGGLERQRRTGRGGPARVGTARPAISPTPASQRSAAPASGASSCASTSERSEHRRPRPGDHPRGIRSSEEPTQCRRRVAEVLPDGAGQVRLVAANPRPAAPSRSCRQPAAGPEFQPGEGRWTVLTDPEGHPICLTAA